MIQIRFMGRGNTRLSARQFGLPLSNFSINGFEEVVKPFVISWHSRRAAYPQAALHGCYSAKIRFRMASTVTACCSCREMAASPSPSWGP